MYPSDHSKLVRRVLSRDASAAIRAIGQLVRAGRTSSIEEIARLDARDEQRAFQKKVATTVLTSGIAALASGWRELGAPGLRAGLLIDAWNYGRYWLPEIVHVTAHALYDEDAWGQGEFDEVRFVALSNLNRPDIVEQGTVHAGLKRVMLPALIPLLGQPYGFRAEEAAEILGMLCNSEDLEVLTALEALLPSTGASRRISLRVAPNLPPEDANRWLERMEILGPDEVGSIPVSELHEGTLHALALEGRIPIGDVTFSPTGMISKTTIENAIRSIRERQP